MSLAAALSKVLDNEGGYVDNPADKGGPTKYGITQATARRHSYLGDMQELPIDSATAIYKAEYWDAPRFDEVAKLDEDLAARLFDFGVNGGTGTSVELLQKALSILSGKAIAADGQLGPASFAALESTLKAHSDSPFILLGLVRALQVVHYAEIVERNATQERFLLGWLRRVLA
jgi:lysozyme family protein